MKRANVPDGTFPSNLTTQQNCPSRGSTMSSSSFQLTSLVDNHAAALLARGRVDEALRAAGSALAAARDQAENDPSKLPLLARALQTLADAQRESGDVAACEASYEEALEVAAHSNSDPALIAQIRTSLATLLDFSEREALAAPLYEQAIADYEGLNPPNEEIAAQLRNNLAMIYKGLGKFALAEQHYLRSLEALENRHGRNSDSVAAVYNNLGSLYYTAGFPDQAKEMFEEALSVRLALLGKDHPDVAQSYCNLGSACHELGDNAAALAHYEASLRILELNIATEAASYEAVGNDYIGLLQAAGEEKKAAAFSKRMEKVLASA